MRRAGSYRHVWLAALAAALVTAAAAVLFFVAVPALGNDYDCDKRDVAERDEDCGYYVQRGTVWVWVWYPWVDPVAGGHPPTRARPTRPPGARTAKPAQTGSVQQPAQVGATPRNGQLRPDQPAKQPNQPVAPAQPAPRVVINRR